MAVITSTADLLAIAEWLVDTGRFSTITEAMQYANYWRGDAYAAWESFSGAVRMVSGGSKSVVVSTSETALEVASRGSLEATATEIKSVGVSLTKKVGSGGTTEFGFKALMGMDLGVAAAAAAPLLGVAIGVDLYESNPELWEKISTKLLPFCYPDTTTIPTWADIAATAWSCSIAKEVIDALKELFEEEGIVINDEYAPSQEMRDYYENPINVDTSTSITYTGQGGSYPRVEVCNAIGAKCALRILNTAPNQASVIWVSKTPGDVVLTYPDGYKVVRRLVRHTISRTGEIAYWPSPFVSDLISNIVGPSPCPYVSTEQIADTILNGNPVSQPLPPGLSNWRGTKFAELPESDPIITDQDGTSRDTVPISPPINIPTKWQPGRPVPTGDPEEQEDPTKIVEPTKQIQRWICPEPVPWLQLPPGTGSESPEGQQPEEDPSKPKPPSQTIVDILPGPPTPGGITPWPTMPGTVPPFSQNVGLVTVYHPTTQQLYEFERWLWVTYSDATIDKIFNNPFDGVITLFELYCTPTDIGTRTIRSGFLDSGINSAVISRYTEIDCGTLGIPEYYGNYFDYSPYSKAHIYLPFIGIQELNVDDIVGHAVNVTYRIDEYNGSCIAMITVAKVTEVNGETVEYSNTMYQFSGNCSVELPLVGASQASIKAGMMTADAYQRASQIAAGAQMIGGIGSLLLGSIGGALSGLGGAVSTAAMGEANALSHMLSGKSVVQKSGSFAASHGALGIKTPFITVTRPKQLQVPNYNELYGYPSHKMVTIGACTGFIRCREVHVTSPTANDEEKHMIEQLLKSGIYVTE